MEWLAKIGEVAQIGDWISEPVGHFLAAFLPGVLVFLLMLTIYYVVLRKASPSGTLPGCTVVRCGIILSFLLVAVSVGLGSHYLLDAFSSWWSAPLNPHLTILP